MAEPTRTLKEVVDAVNALPRLNPDISPWTRGNQWLVKRIEVLAVFREADYPEPLGAMRAAYEYTEAARKKEGITDER
jgi:hypothetical protein